MEFLNLIKQTDNRIIQIILSVILLFFYVTVIKIAARIITRYGKSHEISHPRVVYTKKYFRFIIFVFCLMLLGIIWDISFEGLSVYFLSFFTVAGIGLFASWSILSNITAAIILFFYFPYRIGERIKIIDGDNSVEGEVVDLKMFSIVIKNDAGQKVTYPNNVVLQKAVIHLVD